MTDWVSLIRDHPDHIRISRDACVMRGVVLNIEVMIVVVSHGYTILGLCVSSV